jgi:DNA polymerase III subunit beta
MKVQVPKVVLSQVLQKVYGAADKKVHMPILSNVLIEASDSSQEMEFTATDLELSMWTKIGATVEEPGRLTVSAKKLLEIVRELPHEIVQLQETASNRLIIVAGRSRFELATIPADDFPFVNFFSGIPLTGCDPELFRKCLAKTQYGIPLDDDPFSMSGVFCHFREPDAIRFVSSDGHRLALYEVASESFQGLNFDGGIIIPRKGAQEILKVLEKEDKAEHVLLGLHENALILKTQDTLVSVQLLEGEFPEYQLIIPEERPSFFSVEGDSLYAALKRVGILTDQRWRHVRFHITENNLELESGNPELGQATDNIDIVYSGEPFSIAFNLRYVLDALQALESGEVRFEWVDQFHGGVFVGIEDPGYLGLIMPMVI